MLLFANSSAVFQKLDDGAVLFVPETEIYFGLNEVGAIVWELLSPQGASLDDLCAPVAARFPDVPIATIQTDVGELLDKLVDARLARRA
jgi:hypothetical protein